MGKDTQGFASMPPARRVEVAGKGGREAHRRGTAHRWTSEQARAAGRKGGRAKKKPLRTPEPVCRHQYWDLGHCIDCFKTQTQIDEERARG
jgi:general stress protein YciG